MDALVIHAAGDLRVQDVPTPEVLPHQLKVKVRFGGICGSDLHYFQHGGFGTVRVKEPMVLGHEVAGVIEAAGRDVRGFAVGDRIAISPSRPCGACRFCQQGLQNHCLDMRYYGSAMRTPHVQGAFRREIVVETAQAYKLAAGVSDREGAMAEPLAVALHAVRRAGPLLGKNVLVTGCGPIGALAVIAARHAGASNIVVTDVGDFTLRSAIKVGADQALNVAEQPDALAAFAADKGQFDVLLEASGNERALRGAFDALRPRGIVVQIGIGGEMNLPMNVIVAKEFDLRGTFRFHEEFGIAVDLLNKGLVDVKPLISATVPYRDAGRAFALAADRSQAMKVLLDFE
jgi:L-idonate 5-dehydrogenase